MQKSTMTFYRGVRRKGLEQLINKMLIFHGMRETEILRIKEVYQDQKNMESGKMI